MTLSVIIVSYNVRHYLDQCLRSVFAAGKGLEMEVFVVDNCSTDDSVSHLAGEFPQVHFMANKENIGFSRANNQAIRLAVGRYVLLLNPDTIVTERTFTDCIAYLDEHPEVGATGAAMYGRTGNFAWESRRGVPTPWVAFCKMSGLSSLFPHSRRFGRYYMRYLNRDEANYIEIISGAFFMLRRQAVEQVGMLDEDFFMYGEDIDLSYRLLQAGWKNAYVPTPILHYKGESTQKTTYRYVHIFYRAMLVFFDKNLRARYRVASFFVRIAVVLRAVLDVLLSTLRKPFRLLARWLRPSFVRPEAALCIASSDSENDICRICMRNNLVVTFTDEAAVANLSPEETIRFSYIIYDLSIHSYEQVLASLMRAAERGQELAIGTYAPHTKTIILPNDIYQ